jgi:hypothetical protein
MTNFEEASDYPAINPDIFPLQYKGLRKNNEYEIRQL